MACKDKIKIKEIFSNLVDEEKNGVLSEEKISATLNSNASCNPRSKDLFLERVKTFTTTNWVAKPVQLSPLHCAQYGWCNEHLDQLRCVTCNATIYAAMPDDWDSCAYAEICNKIQKELQIGHERLCPWPDNPCPLSFLSMPSCSGDQWKVEIKKAFDGLIQLDTHLPELNEDEIASMRLLDNTCIEAVLSNIFQFSGENDDEALQGKVACILSICGWSASKPIVEDPSISCIVCGKESGLWNFKSLSKSNHKRSKTSFEHGSATSQQSLPDIMSSNVSIKSEKSENSTHSGSMIHDLSKLATSSDSLAQSDLLKPASSQESLVNLRVSDSKQMDGVEHHDNDYDSFGHEDFQAHQHENIKSLFSEPRLPHATPPELMKELLLSTAPGSGCTHSRYSDSIFSEVGSECFDKRLEDTSDKDLELDKAITENPPSSQPNIKQQQWMKELLFMTAESHSSEVTESVMSEIGSVTFDHRLDNSSVLNSPRATTPVSSQTYNDAEYNVKTKRMRFQECDISLFNVLDEHRHWCPWITSGNDVEETSTSDKSSSWVRYNNKLPGWKSVLLTLLPSLQSETRNVTSPPHAEAWRSVRSVLRDCVAASPYKT